MYTSICVLVLSVYLSTINTMIQQTNLIFKVYPRIPLSSGASFLSPKSGKDTKTEPKTQSRIFRYRAVVKFSFD